jgi:hypothetical protein
VDTRTFATWLEQLEQHSPSQWEQLHTRIEQTDTLARLRGFALDFAEGEKVFPCESMPGLWISPENPL